MGWQPAGQCCPFGTRSFAANLTEEKKMAKGQLRSNREKKKPKQAKAKPAGAVSQFTVSQPKSGSSSGKKQ
jgi:hypothetical protein